MKRLTILVLSLSFYTASAQYTRYTTFDLMYLVNQSTITPTQKNKLNQHIQHVISCNIISVFIDATASKSTKEVSENRILELRKIFNSYEIDDARIQIVTVSKPSYDFIHNLSEQVDAVQISISYTSNKPISTFQDTMKPITSEKILMIESGEKSSTLADKTTCNKNVLIELPEGIELILNVCDYEKYEKSLQLNTFFGDEMTFFKKGPELDDMSKILGALHFITPGNHKLQFPAIINIPIEKCMDRFEMNLYICKDSLCTIIPMENLFSVEENMASYKIQQTGEYYLIHNNTKNIHTLEFALPKKFKLRSLQVHTLCHSIEYTARVKKGKILVQIPQTYYEPFVSIQAYDKNWDSYELINTPLKKLHGEHKLISFTAKEYYNPVQEYLVTYFKKYTLKKEQFKKSNR